MAQINSIDVFPSIKEIETDANGDLQEILSADGTRASLVYDLGGGNGAQFNAVADGAEGNKVYMQISDGTNAGADQIDVRNHATVDGAKVVDVQFTETLANAIGGTSDSVIYNNNFSVTRIAQGAGSVQLHVIDQVDNGLAAKASVSKAKFKLEKNVAGAFAGSLAITDNTGLADVVTNNGGVISVDLELAADQSSIQDIVDLLNANLGADFTATVTSGANDVATVSVASAFTGGADDEDQVKIHAADSDISVCLVQNINNYTNNEIYTLLNDGTASWSSSFTGNTAKFSLAITNAPNNASPAINGSFDLVGGSDPSGQTGTLTVIKTLIDGSEDASALVNVTLSGNATTLPVVLSETVLDGGLDATISDLDPNSQYIMIKRDDIYELEEGESGDARKIVWGVLDKYTSHVSGLSAEQLPENFVATRGNPALLIDNAGTRIRQAYSVQAFYATGDWDLEDETSV
jgi:hypothetical protein